jgi:uncharacterized protein (TIGR02246 family)
MELGELQGTYDSLVGAALAKDAEAYVGHFTDDAVLMVPHSPAVVGKTALRAWIGALLSEWSLEIEALEFAAVTVGERVAFTWYTASGKYIGEGGTEVRFDHKYLDTLVKAEGGWQFAAHTASTNDEAESLWATWRPGEAAGSS